MKKINPGLAIAFLWLMTNFTFGQAIQWSANNALSNSGSRLMASSSGQTLPDLNGNWTSYFENGTTARNPGGIRQTGTSVVIDNGEGSRSSGRIENNQIIATDWKLTGTISSDGKRITWTNGTFWTPHNR